MVGYHHLIERSHTEPNLQLMTTHGDLILLNLQLVATHGAPMLLMERGNHTPPNLRLPTSTAQVSANCVIRKAKAAETVGTSVAGDAAALMVIVSITKSRDKSGGKSVGIEKLVVLPNLTERE